jgi:hypothetical protein
MKLEVLIIILCIILFYLCVNKTKLTGGWDIDIHDIAKDKYIENIKNKSIENIKNKYIENIKNTNDTAKLKDYTHNFIKQLDSMSKKREVHIKNNDTDVYLHGNSEGTYGFSNGSKSRDHNWYLVYSGKLTDQTLVYIQSKSANNKNKYWLSNSDKGFIWATEKESDKTWSFIKLKGNNNYAIKSNYHKSFIQSNTAGEGKPFDYTRRAEGSNWEIEFV